MGFTNGTGELVVQFHLIWVSINTIWLKGSSNVFLPIHKHLYTVYQMHFCEHDLNILIGKLVVPWYVILTSVNGKG